MAGSCNGSSNCILWTVTGATSSYSSTAAGTIHALNPVTGAEYWSSGVGLMTKFAQPTVAAGNVYVATQSGYVVEFGKTPPSPTSQISGKATLVGATLQ